MKLLLGLLCGVMAWSAPLRVLIVTGSTDLPYHDWRVTTPFIRGVLEGCGRFEVKVLEEPRGLNAEILSGYDAIVLNYNGPRWGVAAEKAVEEFVRSGKGMLAFHGVSYGTFFGQVLNKSWSAPKSGDQGWTAYAGMLGATWKPENIGHSARHVYPVKWVDRDHPIARGLEPEFLANDELYHKLDLRPNAHVIATAFSDKALNGTGRDEPQIWTVPFGAGRVVHMTLGHDLSAMVQPGFLAAFARGTEWAASGDVTLPPRILARPAPRKDAVRVLVVTGGHSYPTSFYSLFEGYEDMVWFHASTQAQAFDARMKERYDVVVLHDMYDEIAPAARANLQAFVEAGKGVVSTHHAIVDYTNWPWWWEQVIGGKYFREPLGDHPKSIYREGVEMVVQPVKGKASHPVLRGVGPIVVHDEVYKNMWQAPGVTVLMETAHPENDRPVVYLGPSAVHRSVYIQLGHGSETFAHPGYRRLLHNAIIWAARAEAKPPAAR